MAFSIQNRSDYSQLKKKRDNMWTQTTGLVKQVVERILVIHAGHGLAENRQVARV